MTIIRKKHENISYEIEEKICDDCGRIAKRSDSDDTEWKGFYTINFQSFHYSLFDSSMSYELDLCMHCTVRLYKPLLKRKYKKITTEARKRRKCDCDTPILLGSTDSPSIPNGYGRCQVCRVLIKI